MKDCCCVPEQVSQAQQYNNSDSRCNYCDVDDQVGVEDGVQE